MGLPRRRRASRAQRKQLDLRREIEWVFLNLGVADPKAPPSAGSQTFLEWAKENPRSFFPAIMRMAEKAEQPTNPVNIVDVYNTTIQKVLDASADQKAIEGEPPGINLGQIECAEESNGQLALPPAPEQANGK